ncbi:MAG: thiol reductase thioredoxin [Methylococcaceae bacterium]|nr:MAG: thiol reductase thioredoxin [Methylococcaceae bacterium]
MSLLHIVCQNCDGINRVQSETLKQDPRCNACKHLLFINSPLKLTAKNFKAHLSNSDIPVVVFFWNNTCMHYKNMDAAYALVTSNMEPWIRMAKINTEQEQSLAINNKISMSPTLILFRKGYEVSCKTEQMNAGDIMKWITSYI